MTIEDRVKLNSKIKFPSPLSRADMKSIERERQSSGLTKREKGKETRRIEKKERRKIESKARSLNKRFESN